MSGEKQTPATVDEESAALLKDLEKQGEAPAAEKKAAPKKKAAAKKSEPAPVAEKSEPAPVAEKEADSNTVTNTSKNPRRIGGTTVGVGESYTLTEQDMQNESLLLKIDHAIDQGMFRHGAD